jgi:pimeloyl-ACP methyl ester carboxylesterase
MKDLLGAGITATAGNDSARALNLFTRVVHQTDRIWIRLGLVALTSLGLWGCALVPQKSVPSVEATTTAMPVVTPVPNYAPVFESAACEFLVPNQAHVTCGFVRIPEDRNGDLTDTIQIAVAVYHSNSALPKPDPILYLQGGPGQLAIDWSADVYESVIQPLLDERDFIVFDSRGVGYSKPALHCEEIKTTYLSDLQGKYSADLRVSYYEGAFLSCKHNFDKLGADPSTYTSANMAADAKDVLIALGYQQGDLYGVSYGTRIAQFIMRTYPEVVRTAVLDSVVPVENQLLKPKPNEEQDKLIHLLFEDCKTNPACFSAYPDLESAYNEVIKLLDSQPVKTTVTINRDKTLEQTINGSVFRNIVVWGLRNPQTIAAIPHFISRTRNGDYSLLTIATALPLIAFDSISIGTYVSVNCHDQVFAIPTEGLDETIYDLCKLWGIEPPAPGENDPVISDIPTLMLAGKYDSVTPTAFARQLASHLTHNYLVELPNQGHAPSVTEISDCSSRIIAAFLQDPSIPPDLGCVNESNKITFIVPYNAEVPLTLEAVTLDQYQINTRIPTGWTVAQFGFYNRNSMYGDVTQVGVQRAAVPESEWVKWLLTNFGGKRGFDQPAVKQDYRQANGMTWSMYSTSSQGIPVDIAFAKSGNETMMVLLISYKDEHDALYNTVFLPVIDVTVSSK